MLRWFLLALLSFPVWQPCGLDSPAAMSVYDPALGGINCDDDCSTVASGPFDEEMYGVAGACPAYGYGMFESWPLFGQTIEFPGLDMAVSCVDTGPAVRVTYREGLGCVAIYDVLWPLHRADAPGWLWTLQEWQ